MGKLHKEEDDAATSGGGLKLSKLVGRKRDLGWKMICIVTVMGFIGMLQLMVENRWYWSRISFRHEQSPYASMVLGDLGKTTFMRSSSKSSTSSQHAALPSKYKELYLSLCLLKN